MLQKFLEAQSNMMTMMTQMMHQINNLLTTVKELVNKNGST